MSTTDRTWKPGEQVWRREEEQEDRAAWDALTKKQRGDYRMAAAIFDFPHDDEDDDLPPDDAVEAAAYRRFVSDREASQ